MSESTVIDSSLKSPVFEFHTANGEILRICDATRFLKPNLGNEKCDQEVDFFSLRKELAKMIHKLRENILDPDEKIRWFNVHIVNELDSVDVNDSDSEILHEALTFNDLIAHIHLIIVQEIRVKRADIVDDALKFEKERVPYFVDLRLSIENGKTCDAHLDSLTLYYQRRNGTERHRFVEGLVGLNWMIGLRLVLEYNGNLSYFPYSALSEMLSSNENIQELVIWANGYQSFEQKNYASMKLFSESLVETQSLELLSIYGVPIDESQLQLLGKGLSGNETLRELTLTFCNIQKEAAVCIGEALANNNTLKELNLSGNFKVSNQGASSILEALCFNETLEVLDLNNCEIDADISSLVELALEKNKHLAFLNLNGNSIGNEGAFHIALGLQKNKTLKHLEIGDNGILESGIHTIFTSVERHPTLKCLNLRRNTCCENGAGMASLINLLRVNETLEQLELDNTGITRSTDDKLLGILRKNKNTKMKFIKLAFRAYRLKDWSD